LSYFFPQAVITFNIRWETFGRKDDPDLIKLSKFTGIAKRVNVNINSYREADTFSCTLDYRNFPFDPRTIRALGITIHMEDKQKIFNKDGILELIKPQDNKYDKNGKRISGNTIFVGFADEESIDFDEDTRTIKIEGRDYTALLIDSPHSGEVVDYTRSLDKVIRGLLDELEATKKIQIINRTDKDLPTLSQYNYSKGSLDGQRGRKSKDESYWDVITDLVSQAGLIVFVELDKLIITKPRNLYSNKAISKELKAIELKETEKKAYQFIYGKNLKSLSFKRKLGRQKSVNVRIRSVNLANKTEPVLTVDIPKEANIEWCKELGISREEQTIEKFDSEGKALDPEPAPYLTYNVSDIGNKELLIEKGQSVWEEIGRQQIEGELVTKEMKQSQDDDVEFDITKIRNGTPIKVEIGQGDLKGLSKYDEDKNKKFKNKEEENLYRLSLVSARENFLISRGYEPIVAKTFAKTLGKVHPLFYTKAIEFTLDRDDGFTMNLEFINFIEVSNQGL